MKMRWRANPLVFLGVNSVHFFFKHKFFLGRSLWRFLLNLGEKKDVPDIWTKMQNLFLLWKEEEKKTHTPYYEMNVILRQSPNQNSFPFKHYVIQSFRKVENVSNSCHSNLTIYIQNQHHRLKLHTKIVYFGNVWASVKTGTLRCFIKERQIACFSYSC